MKEEGRIHLVTKLLDFNDRQSLKSFIILIIHIYFIVESYFSSLCNN